MSLRTRLLILVIAAMLVPAILVGLRFIQNRTQRNRRRAGQPVGNGQRYSGDLDEKIQGTAQLHYGLARARDLDTNDKAACSDFLSAVREEYTQFTGILTINPDGSLFCDLLRTNRPSISGIATISSRPWLRTGVVTLQPVFGRLTGISVLQIAYPVRSESGRAEIHPARLLQSAEIRGVSRQAAGRATTRSCSSTGKAWSSLRPREETGPSPPAHRLRTPSCSGLRRIRTKDRSAN